MKPIHGNDRGSQPVDLPAAEHSQRSRTRPPASVRVREQLEHEANQARGQTPSASWTGTLPHSSPSVSARESKDIDHEWLTAQVLKLRSGLAAGSLEQIDAAVHELGEAGLRFDSGALAMHPAAADFRGQATLRVLQLRGRHEVREHLAVRLIELGCDPNACDEAENTVLMYAAKFGMAELVDCLLADCPELALHRLNFYGRNAAMIAHANGNQPVLAVLESVGVMLNPPNPALMFYQSSRERFTSVTAQEAYDQLWRLLQRTHYMNLADATGKTLIFHAVLNQDVEMVHFLCRRSDYPDLSLRDHEHRSVFDYAALIGDENKRKDIMAALKSLRSTIRPMGEFRMPKH